MSLDDTMTAPANAGEQLPVDSTQNYLRAIYTFRCIDAKYKKSASGNRMIMLTWEVIAPESARTKEGVFYIVGMQATNFLMLETQYASATNKFLAKMGLPTSIDYDNPDVEQFKGLMLRAIAGSRLREQMGQKIDEATGNVVAVKLVDEDGKPIQSYRFEMSLADVLNRYEGDAPAF